MALFPVGTPINARPPDFRRHQARPITMISPQGLNWSPYLKENQIGILKAVII